MPSNSIAPAAAVVKLVPLVKYKGAVPAVAVPARNVNEPVKVPGLAKVITVLLVAGNVIVVVPAMADACSVVVPLVEPLKATVVTPVNEPETFPEPLKF